MPKGRRYDEAYDEEDPRANMNREEDDLPEARRQRKSSSGRTSSRARSERERDGGEPRRSRRSDEKKRESRSSGSATGSDTEGANFLSGPRSSRREPSGRGDGSAPPRRKPPPGDRGPRPQRSSGRNESSNTSSTGKRRGKKDAKFEQEYKDVEETGSWGKLSPREVRGVAMFSVTAVIAAIVAIVLLTRPDPEPVIPTAAPTQTPVFVSDTSIEKFKEMSPDTNFPFATLQELASKEGDTSQPPQVRAAAWILSSRSSLKSETDDWFLDKYALATIYYALGGDQWTIQNKWLQAANPCDWFGLTCNRLKNKLEIVELTNNNLKGGPIPLEIGLLNTTKEFGMANNLITGPIPSDGLFKMGAVKFIHLKLNQLTGTFPEKLMNEARWNDEFYGPLFDFSGNNLVGTVPASICARATGGKAVEPNLRFVVDCDEVTCGCCETGNRDTGECRFDD